MTKKSEVTCLRFVISLISVLAISFDHSSEFHFVLELFKGTSLPENI